MTTEIVTKPAVTQHLTKLEPADRSERALLPGLAPVTSHPRDVFQRQRPRAVVMVAGVRAGRLSPRRPGSALEL